jgi:hypothetical protein
MVRLKGVPPFESALFWHANAAPRCIVYLSWWIPVHCCWATGPKPERLFSWNTTSCRFRGEPAKEIADFARQIGADLIVLGHRRQSAFDRWWSGPRGAYLIDYTECSLLLVRVPGPCRVTTLGLQTVSWETKTHRERFWALRCVRISTPTSLTDADVCASRSSFSAPQGCLRKARRGAPKVVTYTFVQDSDQSI